MPTPNDGRGLPENRPRFPEISGDRPDGAGDAGGRRAAFFGLDNTLVPGSSLFLLLRGLYERELFGMGSMLRMACLQTILGGPPRPGRAAARRATKAQVESSKKAALDFVEGMHRPEMQAVAHDIVSQRMVPLVYPAMAAYIGELRAEGVLTFVTTAAPAEVAEIVAEGLGMTGALGTRAEVNDDERYSGRLAGSVMVGATKAAAIRELAVEHDIDLSRSIACSHSLNDLPMLELVGHPEVVHPERRLRQMAVDRNWRIHRPRALEQEERERKRFPVPHRLAELGLQSTEWQPEGHMGRRARNHYFVADDPKALIEELESTGRFRRDTPLGGILHRGEISLREVSPTHSLHITLGRGNRVSVHVDRYSPLAKTQPESGARYSVARVAAHNVTGIASDLVRIIPRPRFRPRRGEDRARRERKRADQGL